MPNETKTSHQIDRFDLNAIYETSRLLSTSIDLEFVLNNLLLTAMSKLLVTRGVALLYEPVEGGYRVVAAKGAVGMASGELVLLDEEQRLDTFPKREVLRDDAVPETLRERRIRLVLPVASGDREIGLIGLGGKATGAPFERPELEFIQSLVQMSASAVHNSMMVRELQQANRDLDDKIQQLNTLFDLSQEFNATIDHNHLVKLLSFALMGQMGVRRFALVLRRTDMADGPVWDPIAHKGTAPEAFSGVPDEAYAKARELILLEETDLEVWAPLAEAGLTLALPLRQQNETTGVLCLGPKLSEASYTPEDVEFLYALGNLALVSIQNSFLVEEQIEKERLEKEVNLARDIQRRLLPDPIPTVNGIAVDAIALPSREVGGDYFDVAHLKGNRLLLAVADVTGKGVPASLLMANMQASLRVVIPMDITLEDATAQINNVMCRNTDAATFITFFAGIYHADTREFTYVNAGHNPPLVVRTDGRIERLETGGLLLGVMKNNTYTRGDVTLAPGDVMALYSDGVTEAMSPDQEEYGEERFESCLRAHRDEAASDILKAVRAELRTFTGDTKTLSDDLTLVVAKAEERSVR